jgi:molybdopterin-synthase adenylyltransferase
MQNQKITQNNITICGAGTLGGNLSENLARTGFVNLQIIDDDKVEERNLTNQPYFSSDLGQFKVKALSQSLFRAAGAKVTGANQRLTLGNGEKLLRNSHLVIDAFDNSDSRKAVKEICGKNGIPCLHLGMSPDGCGEIIWNETYIVPPDSLDDPCGKPTSRNLSLLVCAAATESIMAFFENGEKKNFTVTIKDLCIMAV